ATFDAVDELEAGAPGARGEPHHCDTELTAPARLLLVLALRLGGGGDRLPVGDLRERRLDLYPEVAGDPGEGHFEVVVAEAGDDGLACFRPSLDAQGRVGFGGPGQGGRQFLLVRLGLRG